jgi:hypothetical protein
MPNLKEIQAQHKTSPKMSVKEFMTYCTACGGNWTAMLLSGIRVLAKTSPEWQAVYDSLPEGEIGYEVVAAATEPLVDWDKK